MIQIQTTTSSKNEAASIADRLVHEKLAACAQIIGPVQSTYRWHGEVEEAEEWMVLVKTRTENYERVEKAILETHSYDTPEIIAMPIQRADTDYQSWLCSET